MVAYRISVAKYRPFLYAVAAHGLSDADSVCCFPAYALAFSIPMSSNATTVLFCCLSLLHFAEDVGVPWSLLLHCGAAFATLKRGNDAGFFVIFAYSALVHVPCHLHRLWKHGRHAAALLVAVAGAAAALGSRRLPGVLLLDDAAQRVIIAHIFVECMHAFDNRLLDA